MKNNSTKSEKCIKRSEKVNKILTQLEHGTKELFNSERYQKYLVTFSKFTNYSINNTILIYLQNPNATLVAGYKAWETKFNRHVKQGEEFYKVTGFNDDELLEKYLDTYLLNIVNL